MLLDDKVLISTYFRTIPGKEFMGVIPVLDVDRFSYLSVPNEHPGKKFERVSPVFGFICEWCYGDHEHYYSKLIRKEDYKISGHRGSYEDYLLLRDEVRNNVKDNPYMLYFMGCDDGSTGMRFANREDAIDYISKKVVYFDEIYDDKSSFSIN